MLYDVASQMTVMTFTSTLVWPYQIAAIPDGWWLSSVGVTGNVTATVAASSSGDDMCDQTQDSYCTQTWVVTINTKPNPTDSQVCNLQGGIKFTTGILECRDLSPSGSCPGNPTSNFTLAVGQTDLCDSKQHQLDATAGLTHTLESFFDSEYTVSQNVFQTGDMVYFQLIVNDPLSTIDAITFNEVSVSDPTMGHSNSLFLVQNVGDAISESISAVGSQVSFNVTQDLRAHPDVIVTPGVDAVLMFQFRLQRDILTAISALSSMTPSDETSQITVSATVDIKYHGNWKKRSFASSASIPSTSHTMLSLYNWENYEEQEAVIAEQQNDFDETSILSLFANSATCQFSFEYSMAIVIISTVMLFI